MVRRPPRSTRTASLFPATTRFRSIPVIASLGETSGGQILNINADFAANALVRELRPYKIVFLTGTGGLLDGEGRIIDSRSEEHTSELQSLMRISYAVFCLKKKKNKEQKTQHTEHKKTIIKRQ